MTSEGTASGRFTRAIAQKNLRGAEMAARELGRLSLRDALKLCVLLAERDLPRFDRAALRWLEDWREGLLAGSRHDVFRSFRQALAWGVELGLVTRNAS